MDLSKSSLSLVLTSFVVVSSAAAAADKCPGLKNTKVPAEKIGLLTQGAVLESAAAYPAADGLPETCRVVGSIIGADASTPSIKFQINLPRPDKWNGKALQYGGGGFDGVLVDGLHNTMGVSPVSAPPPNPLLRGFVTFGSDGGHEASPIADAGFGRNAGARENYAGAAVKRTRDTTVAIIQLYYGSAPKRVYFLGGSKGGQEALVAAQRYGDGYDGVISYFPGKDTVALNLVWGALSEAAYGPGGASLTAAKQRFFQQAVLNACDELDGLKDGIIANTRACTATVSPASFRCAKDATSTENCLTDAEISTLDAGLRRHELPFPLANGVSSFGPFPVMNGASLDMAWFSETGQQGTAYNGLATEILRNFWTEDDNATFRNFDPLSDRKDIEARSRESDATSTDLDPFVNHGGKMILIQGSLDMLVPPAATTDYFVRVASRYGDRTPQIVKYFIQPGYSHGFGPFALSWDALGALDAWVEEGKFPSDPVAVDGNPATRDRQMPLCEYPLFPRYIHGDPSKAASFRCVTQ